jgi:intracellular multiplication protein IcmK
MIASSAAAQEATPTDASDLLMPPATYQTQPSEIIPGVAVPGQTTAQQQQQNTGANDEEVNEKAFKEALKQLYPLTPDQQRTVRDKGDKNDRALGQPLLPVSPVSRSVRVSLKPGDMPPVVQTSPGWISTLTFADVTGQPWPVLSVTNGNSDAYDVKNSGPAGSSNIVTISSKQAYVPSNIAVTLAGARVPVMITLNPSTNGKVDFRVDAQIDQRGPNSSYDVVTSDALPPTGDSVMLGFLDGVPPDSATKLKTSDGRTQAWRYNDMMYIRTTNILLSPAYISKQSNVVGVNVYVLNEVPVLMMSGSGQDAGRMDSVTIQR